MINKLNEEHLQDFDSMSLKELAESKEKMRRKGERRGDEKRELQVSLAKNKTLLMGRMDYERKQKLLNIRNSLLERMAFVEKQLTWAKRMVREMAVSENGKKSPELRRGRSTLKRECIESLVALREKYQQFAADDTRVSSMKNMAAKFTLELNEVIRASLKKPIELEQRKEETNERL